jgi:integrase
LDLSNTFKTTKRVGGKVYPYWCAKLTFDLNPATGVVPKPRFFYGKTQTEAAKKRAAAVQAPATMLPGARRTFVAFIRDEFIPHEEARSRVEHRVSTTWTHRRARLNNYLLSPNRQSLKGELYRQVTDSAVRSALISHLTPEHVEAFFRLLVNGGVGVDTLLKLRQDFTLALRLAKRSLPNRLRDYFEDIRFTRAEKSERAVFDWRQVFAVCGDPSKPMQARALVHAEVELLARPSEIWALRWSDIDLSSRTAILNKALRRTFSGQVVTPDSKIGSRGNRMVPFSAALAQTLGALKASRRAGPDDFVFLSHSGLALTKKRFDATWRATRKALGLPDGPTFYSLKHLANSFAREHGASPSALKDRMGHSSERMGATTYRVALGLEQRAVVSIFEAALASVTPSTDSTTVSGGNLGANLAPVA